eukprot:SRR837773.10531.p1 GENE.SRR837773.10531~~SRR837773.10531.p1  ORF type:complete len:307 (+),score=49.09 SRR837773.10531:118-921(+)
MGHAGAVAAEGWGLLVGGGFPSFAGSSGTVTYRHIRSILSETTSTAFTLASPNVSRQDGEAIGDGHGHGHGGRPAAHRQPPGLGRFPVLGCGDTRAMPVQESVGQSGRQDWAWICLRESLLFLAPKASNWAPYAFIHLRGVSVRGMDAATCTITLCADMSLPKAPDDPRLRQVGLRCNGGLPEEAKEPGEPEWPSLQLVFLLPDGRWQILELPRLRIQVPDVGQLESWRRALAAHCTFLEGSPAAAAAGPEAAERLDRAGATGHAQV